jgi:hypothetical protein
MFAEGLETPPVILDDPFIHCDDYRIARTLPILTAASGSGQIVLTTLSENLAAAAACGRCSTHRPRRRSGTRARRAGATRSIGSKPRSIASPDHGAGAPRRSRLRIPLERPYTDCPSIATGHMAFKPSFADQRSGVEHFIDDFRQRSTSTRSRLRSSKKSRAARALARRVISQALNRDYP